jgi:excisionase family DNA binding protein
MTRPYTPATLAERWGCSARHVRDLIAEGQLEAFRLGDKLLRIKPEAVEAFECQRKTTRSDDCGRRDTAAK